jgi:hypothetical protein
MRLFKGFLSVLGGLDREAARRIGTVAAVRWFGAVAAVRGTPGMEVFVEIRRRDATFR